MSVIKIKPMREIKSVHEIAFIDISNYIKESTLISRGFHEIWIVTPAALCTKENRRLNRELGLHKLNYRNNALNFKRK